MHANGQHASLRSCRMQVAQAPVKTANPKSPAPPPRKRAQRRYRGKPRGPPAKRQKISLQQPDSNQHQGLAPTEQADEPESSSHCPGSRLLGLLRTAIEKTNILFDGCGEGLDHATAWTYLGEHLGQYEEVEEPAPCHELASVQGAPEGGSHVAGVLCISALWTVAGTPVVSPSARSCSTIHRTLLSLSKCSFVRVLRFCWFCLVLFRLL
jgi:hypothetical protein